MARPQDFALIKKESDLSTMENRIINTIYSFAKGKTPFKFDRILELIHEENKDIVIDALEKLMWRRLIVPYIKVEHTIVDINKTEKSERVRGK